MADNRRVTITIGAQRSGKSHKTNEDIKKHLETGQMAFVYNIGKNTDWDSCQHGKLLDMRGHEEFIYKNLGSKQLKEFKRFRDFIYFKDNIKNGRIHKIEDMNSILYGKGIKFHRTEIKTEELLFYAYVKSVSNCLLVFDDALPIFNCNLKGWMNNLLTRVNHTGEEHTNEAYQGAGSDVVLIFHSLNQVPAAILQCYQKDWIFRTFRYSEQPDFDRIKNYELRMSLASSFGIIGSEPEYSYTEYNKGKTKLFKFIGVETGELINGKKQYDFPTGEVYEEYDIDITL